MKLLTSWADRLLSLVVPKTEASACQWWVTQSCCACVYTGCWRGTRRCCATSGYCSACQRTGPPC